MGHRPVRSVALQRALRSIGFIREHLSTIAWHHGFIDCFVPLQLIHIVGPPRGNRWLLLELEAQIDEALRLPGRETAELDGDPVGAIALTDARAYRDRPSRHRYSP